MAGYEGCNTPLLAAMAPEGADSSAQANTPPEQSEGKVSGGHFSACTGEVYLYLLKRLALPLAAVQHSAVVHVALLVIGHGEVGVVIAVHAPLGVVHKPLGL